MTDSICLIRGRKESRDGAGTGVRVGWARDWDKLSLEKEGLGKGGGFVGAEGDRNGTTANLLFHSLRHDSWSRWCPEKRAYFTTFKKTCD